MSNYDFMHLYQKRASTFWVDNKQVYYMVDCGLGKTVIVLHALVKLRKPALIIAPLRVVYSVWPQEIEKWKFPMVYSIIHGKKKEEALQKQADIYITNYETIPWLYDNLRAMTKKKQTLPFDVLVVDEGSAIKSPRTKRFKYLEAMKHIFGYRAILSGTPAPRSLRDLWAQYYILTDGKTLGDNYHAFKNRYYEAHPFNPYEVTEKEGAEEDIHNRVVPNTFRLDAEEYLELPDISYNYIELELPKALRKQYSTYKKEFMLTVEDLDYVALNAATLSNKLRQFLQGFNYYETGEYKSNGDPVRSATEFHTVKLKALIGLIEELNQPLLCTIQFKYELETIRRVYPNAPIIAGGTKPSDAIKYIEQWNKKEIPLLLCHPLSLAHGVNLQSGGCNVLWYCQPWSLEQYIQFNKRLHRQGQSKGVVIHHLVIKNSIDEKVAKVLSQKNMTQQKLLDYLRDVLLIEE